MENMEKVKDEAYKAAKEILEKAKLEKGLKEEAHHLTRELVKTRDAMEIIQQELIPALNVVGDGFEKGTVFLPQLLMSADAAKIAFAVIKDVLAESGAAEEKKEKIYKKRNKRKGMEKRFYI